MTEVMTLLSGQKLIKHYNEDPICKTSKNKICLKKIKSGKKSPKITLKKCFNY